MIPTGIFKDIYKWCEMLCSLVSSSKTNWVAELQQLCLWKSVASLHMNTVSLQLFLMRLWVNIVLDVGWRRSSKQLKIQRDSWMSEAYFLYKSEEHLSVFVANSCVSLLYGLSSAGDVPVSTHSEGHSLWDTRPRQSSSAHTLGTDGLRCPVHIFAQIPHYLTNCSVSMFAAYIEKSSAVLDSFSFITRAKSACS